MKLLLTLTLLTFCSFLLGCKTTEATNSTSIVFPPPANTPGLNLAELIQSYRYIGFAGSNDKPLTLSSGDTLGHHLKNGLRELSRNHAEEIEELAAKRIGTSVTVTAFSYSSTPPDPVDYYFNNLGDVNLSAFDGKYWYILSPTPDRRWKADTITIVATNPADNDIEVISQYSGYEGTGRHTSSSSQAYSSYLSSSSSSSVASSSLRSSSSSQSSSDPRRKLNIDTLFLAKEENAATKIAVLSAYDDTTDLRIINTEDPSTPAQEWAIKIEGRHIYSKQVGNHLYIATLHSMESRRHRLTSIASQNGSESIYQAYERALANMEYTDILAQYQFNDQSLPLTDECLVQSPENDFAAWRNFTYITSINLIDKSLNSTCIATNLETISMTDTFAVITSEYTYGTPTQKQTVVHQFEILNNELTYKATGDIKGSLWTTANDPANKVHIADNTVLLAPDSKLYLMNNQSGTLEATTTTTTNDEILERKAWIDSIRVEGDFIHMVSPDEYNSHLISIKDPSSPWIIKTSTQARKTHSHTIGNKYVFSIIQPSSASGEHVAALYDITGNKPKLIHSLLIGYTHNRAYILNTNESNQRIIIPQYNAENEYYSEGARMIEVNNLNSAKPTLLDAGYIGLRNFSISDLKFILHDDSVFMNDESLIWVAPWGKPEEATGPFVKEKPLF